VLHKKGARGTTWQPLDWFWRGFPAAFRRQVVFFWTAVLLTLLGAAFGAGLVAVDPDHKNDLIPEQFSGHRGDPNDRVAREEVGGGDERLGDVHASFASQLMTHNIQVGLAILALGFTFGVGTVVLLFYNGVILGVIAYDYVLAGQTRFLLAWLLPHGVVELPAIFIAGQAGLLIASASLGWRDGRPWSERLRAVRGDLATLAGGMAVMLVWAGHRRILPLPVPRTGAALLRQDRVRACRTASTHPFPWPAPPPHRPRARPVPVSNTRLHKLDIRLDHGVVFALPLAGPAVRSAAAVIDMMIVLVILNLTGLLAMVLSIVSTDPLDRRTSLPRLRLQHRATTSLPNGAPARRLASA
jgi:uncharacterized membrane protein SpoIIM required for sporulation